MSKNTYKYGLPFDNVKIILNTIMGSPRYQFKLSQEDKFLLIAHNETTEKAFSVSISDFGPCIDEKYAEEVMGRNSLEGFKEYGKLFYEFGNTLLTELAASFLKRDAYGNAVFANRYRAACTKLGVAFSRFYSKYCKLVGVTIPEVFNEYENDQNYYDLSGTLNYIDHVYELSMKEENSYVEFAEVLVLLYNSLTIYLTGIFNNISDKIGIDIKSLYNDESERTMDQLSNNLISTNLIEDDAKYKLISLLYLYYLITDFYNKFSGKNIVTKINQGFYGIGKKLSELDLSTLEEELDISYLTQSEVESESRESLMNILKPVSVIDNPSVFDLSLRERDTADLCLIGYEINRFFFGKSNEEVTTFDPFIESESITESKVDVLYNHFVENIGSEIPKTISPRYFFQVSVYAAAFRKIKEEKSGKMKEMAALGLYQAEAIMTLLYKKWYLCKDYYREIGKGICVKDVRRVAQDIKVKAYLVFSIVSYSIFVAKINKKTERLPNMFFTSIRDIIDHIDSVSDDLSGDKNQIENILSDSLASLLPYVNDSNSEKYDECIKALNDGTISFVDFVVSTRANAETYNEKYANTVLESDYEQKALDTLTEYANKDLDYNTICDCKLAKALVGNIQQIIKDEKSNERFVMYFNTFIKNSIPLYLAKSVFEKFNKVEEDNLGNTIDEEENILPNLKSNRMFNFMNK